MTGSVLFSAPYMIPLLARFRPYFAERGLELFTPQVVERLTEEQLLPYAGQVDGVLCGDDVFSERVLQAFAPRLKVISKWGTGIDSIDSRAAEQLGIRVCNTPGAFSHGVADSVLGYVLAFARRGPWMDRKMKAGEWEKLPGRTLRECSLGVVGVGRCGKEVLRRAKAFGMQLLGNDIVPIAPSFIDEVGVRMLPLPELLHVADFVSINCDLNPTSRHLIDAAALSQMKPEAVLVNCARGPVVSEHDLIEALRSGRLAGAALDVFEDEPLTVDSPLRSMECVLLAPHNANSSPADWERTHVNTLRNLFLGLGLSVPPALDGG